jgi:GGDEF domain-containing protein
MNCAFWDGLGKDWEEAVQSALREFKPKTFPFKKFSELSRLARHTVVDAVIIPCRGPARRELDLGIRAKTLPSLMVVPVVLWHPDPETETAQRILNSPVDDLVVGDEQDLIAHARLRSTIHRSQRAIDVNPSSRLPGPMTIESVLKGKISRQERFAVCYADLDDFKAYNDYYGYFYGDKVIKITARVIRETVCEFQSDGFVGHIGGDDFVFVVDAPKAERLCETIIDRFDSEIGSCYDPRDRRNGYIITKNRRSVPETFPLMGLSIAVVVNRGRTFTHVGEISHMVADLKKYAKTLPGSNFVIERRSKY